jgi:hypothetical protein
LRTVECLFNFAQVQNKGPGTKAAAEYADYHK